jgi:metal-sulfur cluster biosynthetic enzyme
MHPVDTHKVNAIRQALRNVIDPELGINVVDLGMIQGIEHDGDSTTVSMVLTTMTCPFWELFVDQVRTALRDVPGVGDLHVRYDPSKRWTPEMLADEARWELEIAGLLPTTTWLTSAPSFAEKS